MGHFDDCRPEDRFTFSGPSYLHESGGPLRTVFDWDKRAVLSIATTWREANDDFFLDALDLHIDDIPDDTIMIEVDDYGELLFTSPDNNLDRALLPYYPLLTDFPADTPTVRRSQLVEVERMGIQVDHVTYHDELGQERHAAFKYYFNIGNHAGLWHELNSTMRIPAHPSIVPVDRLVIDQVNGQDKVVGFTTLYISGGTVRDNVDRLFKLKYLKQLLAVIDYLNLELGLVHGDVCIHNLLIDSETDSLRLFDFNLASKLGWEGDVLHGRVFDYDEHRNDVKNAIFTLYELITRDSHFREEFYAQELNVSMVLDIKPWQLDPRVQLDADPLEYRQVLEEWVSARAKIDREVTHYEKTSNPLDWPSLPEYPEVLWGGVMMKRSTQLRSELTREGVEFLKWQRPASCKLPLQPGRKLLSTGQVVDELTGELVALPNGAQHVDRRSQAVSNSS